MQVGLGDKQRGAPRDKPLCTSPQGYDYPEGPAAPEGTAAGSCSGTRDRGQGPGVGVQKATSLTVQSLRTPGSLYRGVRAKSSPKRQRKGPTARTPAPAAARDEAGSLHFPQGRTEAAVGSPPRARPGPGGPPALTMDR